MSFVPDYIRRYLHPMSDDGGGYTPSASGLDFSDPLDNLYAFGKLWATYDEQPVFSAFHGLMFGMVGDQRLKPLFGYSGLGQFQAKVMANGHVRLRGKEVGYFNDPRSGEILQHWDNPYTGETVEVFDFLNDRIRGELTPQMPSFAFGDANDAPTLMNEATAIVREDGTSPFILPWQQFGDKVLLAWDYTHRYKNPVTAERWPKAHTGPFINPSEHFTFTTTLAELEDRSNPCATFSCGFSRLSPWWPWMKMGGSGIDGVLFGRMNSQKSNRGFDDIPKPVLAYTEKHHPEFLEAPTDWDDGFPIGTWEAYAKQVPPETT